MSEPKQESTKFSTFGGVFTPSILTILGVIMFMRAGFVIGQAGIFYAIVILIIAKFITTLTTFSISAIATNTEVKGGGAYYLISRTLGPEFGGTIGMTLFLAQALSIPFYIIGFTEALVRALPALDPYYSVVSYSTGVLLFIVSYRGASGAIKVQYGIMVILVISILSFMIGSYLKFDTSIFNANMKNVFSENGTNFWMIFAIYFPAVTGIMAGVNMSGDLKNPAKSIPLGTFLAIGVGFLVYAAQIILVGGSTPRADLIAKPFESLMNNTIFHLGFLVALGVFAATLSSALGSYLGAPRILQSLASDSILKPINPFAKLSKSGEPHRALIFSFIITLGTLYWANTGRAPGNNVALNAVASIVTMFFLWAYGITNLAAFVESYGSNPSFRPRFKFFHWTIALIGALGCIGAAFLINVLAAFVAVMLITLIFLYVKKFVMKTSFGDARRGFYYSVVRSNLINLNNAPSHPKNWRPTIALFTGNPNTRSALVKFADWLGSGKGIIIIIAIIIGKFRVKAEQRKHMLTELDKFIKENGIVAFPQVLITHDMDFGINQLLQSVSIGPLKPNVAMFGWSDNPERANVFAMHMQVAKTLDMSVVVLKADSIPFFNKKSKKRIDIWWRGQENGSLMVILSYLISLTPYWKNTEIRCLRAVKNEEERIYSEKQMYSLIDASRMDANIKIIEMEKSFPEIFRENSSDASLIFLGFKIPEVENAVNFQSGVIELIRDMPPVLLVNSSGEADLFA